VLVEHTDDRDQQRSGDPTRERPAERPARAHTGASIGAIDYVVGPGFGPPPILHRHTREDAGWFILDGEIEFVFAGGDVILAGPGDSVVHPRGCWFRYRNANSNRSARAICWFSPAGFEQFFVDVATRARGHFASGGTMETFAPTLMQIRLQYGDETHPDALRVS